MPKLPKGMFMRGRSYYVRIFEGGRERWRSLGPDYEVACRTLRSIRAGVAAPESGATVATASGEWLASYVRVARSEKNVQMASARSKRYLAKYLGYKLVSRVTADDLE